MATKTVQERVSATFVKLFETWPESSLGPDARLFEDLGLDSLEVVELAVALEDEFSIEISNEAAGAWATVADVAQCVEARLAEVAQ